MAMMDRHVVIAGGAAGIGAALCPGPILSDRVIDERIIDPITAEHRTAEEVKQEILPDMPLAHFFGEIPPVASIVDAVNFLISDKARFITGAILPLDGGKSLAAM